MKRSARSFTSTVIGFSPPWTTSGSTLPASDLARALEDLGASIIGPVGSVADAMSVLAGDTSLNAAVLDVNLAGDKVYPVATELRRRGIAFAFATGYDDWIIPESLADAPRFEKPVNVTALAQVLIAKRRC